LKIACIAGARPNFMKIAPIFEAIGKYPNLKPILVHTGQHYDYEMSQIFFDEFGIPKPDFHLGVGSGSHAVQTAKIMMAFEETVIPHKPDLILVVGDVNSTLACALVGAKLCIPIAHVEAGVRSHDKTMPEEINRILTDAISDYLFATSENAKLNLQTEGIPNDRIYLVGDVMIDTLLKNKEKFSSTNILDHLGLEKSSYALMTLHRASNVDIMSNLTRILDAIDTIQQRIKIVLPLHPRTRSRIKEFGLEDKVRNMEDMIITEPLGYIEFMGLMIGAKFVLTDSGSMQIETTVLNIPCLTLRENTERPETIIEGTNELVGIDTELIVEKSMDILDGKGKSGTYSKLLDGHASERIVSVINEKMRPKSN